MIRRFKIDIRHILLALCCVFSLVMLIGRFNFLSVIAVALAMVYSLLILIVCLIKKRIDKLLLMGYVCMMSGILLLYVIWGAESFGRRLAYNLLYTGIPIALAVSSYFVAKHKTLKAKHIIASLMVIAVLGATTFYFFVISIRLKPVAFSMQKGQDEYLKSINSSANSDPSKPNVLVVLMDDMAYSDISCYSYLGRENATIKTPTLDALADDGVMLDNFYACSPVCSPSRFGMLTGRYASRGYLDKVIFPTAVSLAPFGSTRYVNPFQFVRNVDGILGDEITFPEVMQSAGYNTALFGKWNLGDYGEYLPTNQGFDYFFGSYYVNDMTPYNMVRETGGTAKEVLSHKDLLDQSQTTKILTEEISGYINKSVDNNEKFLAYYATPWPHYPIFSGEKYDKSDDSYIHCIQEFDAYLGTVIDLLKARGVYDDTLIIFTSDNGPGREGVTGALRGRKGTTFDGGQKVPFIATYVNGGIGKGDAFSGNNKITARAMNIDIFPTVLQYIGINALPKDRIIDGVSMYGLLQGDIPQDTEIHDILYHISGGEVLGVQMPKAVDGKTLQFKYYQSVWTENTAFFDQFYKNYLFNLTEDPAEGYNVSMVYPQIAQELSKELQDFRNELKSNRRGIIKSYYK